MFHGFHWIATKHGQEFDPSNQLIIVLHLQQPIFIFFFLFLFPVITVHHTGVPNKLGEWRRCSAGL